MLKKWAVWCMSFCLVGLLFLSMAEAEEGRPTYTIMHPDRETRLRWIERFERTPRVQIPDARVLGKSLRGSLSLLNYLDYIPSERDQGACGNCWAWAGTGVMGIALNVQQNIFDRLSVEFISSCNWDMTCCDGGWLSDFTSFYSITGYAIPWTNLNAAWQDGGGNCNVPCETIATSPEYPIQSIGVRVIPTHNVGQDQAIANIKSVLSQNRGVWFGFFMGTDADWSSFYRFWGTEGEDVIWDFDPTCGKPYTSAGGGHAVLCVGYNDDDPNNAYWMMLNSWGTTPLRLNGLFRVAMDMNYDCADSERYRNLYWQTLNIEFDIDRPIHYVDTSGWCGGFTPCYLTIQEALDAAGTGDVIRIVEGKFMEKITVHNAQSVALQGGWNAAFTSQTSSTYVDSLTIGGSASAVVESVVCQ